MKNILINIYISTPEEGGRITPIFDKYRASFKFKNSTSQNDFILDLKWHDMLEGGNCYEIYCTPIDIDLTEGFIYSGNEFEMREGHKIIGQGVVK